MIQGISEINKHAKSKIKDSPSSTHSVSFYLFSFIEWRICPICSLQTWSQRNCWYPASKRRKCELEIECKFKCKVIVLFWFIYFRSHLKLVKYAQLNRWQFSQITSLQAIWYWLGSNYIVHGTTMRERLIEHRT